GNIDITRAAKKVTVQWSLLDRPSGEQKNMLIAGKAFQVTLYRNAFTRASERNPQATYDDVTLTTDPKTTLEMANNFVMGWSQGYGTRVRFGTTANILANLWAANGGDEDDPLLV